ncbi:hypothetical protein MRX96_025007 [Rhipicephalus microplus]
MRSEANRRDAGSRGVPRGDLPSRAVSATRQIAHRAGLPFVARRPDKPYRVRLLCAVTFCSRRTGPWFAALGTSCIAWSRVRRRLVAAFHYWTHAERIRGPKLEESEPLADFCAFVAGAPSEQAPTAVAFSERRQKSLGSDYGTTATVGWPLSD